MVFKAKKPVTYKIFCISFVVHMSYGIRGGPGFVRESGERDGIEKLWGVAAFVCFVPVFSLH